MKQTTGVFAVLTAALLLGGTLGVGCGGDDDNGSGGAAGTGGSAGSGTAGKAGSGGSTGGTGGTGGSTGGTAGTTDGGGKAGSAGSAGSADSGSDAPTQIACGNKMCGPVSGALGTLQPCCPTGETNACGGILTVANNTCVTTTPGPADSTCPSITQMGVPLAGCCRPNGLCGLNVSILGLGCGDPTPLGGTSGNMACGGGDGGGQTDAPRDTGTTDTGTTDTGTTDTGTTDTGTTDTGTTDTGTTDTGTTDTGTDSAPPSDATAG